MARARARFDRATKSLGLENVLRARTRRAPSRLDHVLSPALPLPLPSCRAAARFLPRTTLRILRALSLPARALPTRTPFAKLKAEVTRRSSRPPKTRAAAASNPSTSNTQQTQQPQQQAEVTIRADSPTTTEAVATPLPPSLALDLDTSTLFATAVSSAPADSSLHVTSTTTTTTPPISSGSGSGSRSGSGSLAAAMEPASLIPTTDAPSSGSKSSTPEPSAPVLFANSRNDFLHYNPAASPNQLLFAPGPPADHHPAFQFQLLQYTRGEAPKPVARAQLEDGMKVLLCVVHPRWYLGFKTTGDMFLLNTPTTMTLWTVKTFGPLEFALVNEENQWLAPRDGTLAVVPPPPSTTPPPRPLLFHVFPVRAEARDRTAKGDFADTDLPNPESLLRRPSVQQNSRSAPGTALSAPAPTHAHPGRGSNYSTSVGPGPGGPQGPRPMTNMRGSGVPGGPSRHPSGVFAARPHSSTDPQGMRPDSAMARLSNTSKKPYPPRGPPGGPGRDGPDGRDGREGGPPRGPPPPPPNPNVLASPVGIMDTKGRMLCKSVDAPSRATPAGAVTYYVDKKKRKPGAPAEQAAFFAVCYAEREKLPDQDADASPAGDWKVGAPIDVTKVQDRAVILVTADAGRYLCASKGSGGGMVLGEAAVLDAACLWTYIPLPHSSLAFALRAGAPANPVPPPPPTAPPGPATVVQVMASPPPADAQYVTFHETSGTVALAASPSAPRVAPTQVLKLAVAPPLQAAIAQANMQRPVPPKVMMFVSIAMMCTGLLSASSIIAQLVTRVNTQQQNNGAAPGGGPKVVTEVVVASPAPPAAAASEVAGPAATPAPQNLIAGVQRVRRIAQLVRRQQGEASVVIATASTATTTMIAVPAPSGTNGGVAWVDARANIGASDTVAP
ncbi:hypothetical protein AMAG_12441 [Allomyces macrogynus ATCC 38327]|uniref:Uncharacterized protein n=1 Tax=Allomyces macrogynus (strain ATCC 38327) TaxID=578462 RepID=A0A0L0SZF6_ALLM3|nr:hypothetical protein AMAG_12441 [Allomyces macrogynus ATCC 38327]|eukprot:KNE67709.1 hypothetical protein AMAG_12441 [Allomyces macrogynus ATCC 38327]